MSLLTNAEAGRIPLGDGVVNSHCTSPPYWRLRNYSGKKEEEEDPQRIYWPEVTYRPGPGLPEITVPAGMYALGMEPTPELFIAHLVLVYKEVYRVTREDSCGWCVIGDCFWDSNKRRATRQVRPLRRGEEDGQLIGIPGMLWKALQADGWYVRNDVVWFKKSPMPESVQGARWERHRIKIALGRPAANQSHLPEDGKRPGGNRGNQWGDVQNQPNAEWQDCPGCPQCEPHGGYVLRRGSWRHTRAHETILMLAKSMGYWCNQEAVREARSELPQTAERRQYPVGKAVGTLDLQGLDWQGQSGVSDWDNHQSGRNPRSVRTYDDPTRDLISFIPHEAWTEFLTHWAGEYNRAATNPADILTPKPSPFGGQHYAVYPPDLIRSLIRASTPRQCCPECGAGWAAVVERQSGKEWDTPKLDGLSLSGMSTNGQGNSTLGASGGSSGWNKHGPKSTVLAHRPTCGCNRDDWTPGLVLDQFVGSGTTLEVAREEGLNAIGLDLSYDYLHDQARARLGFVALAEWENGKDGTGEPLEDLPLFAQVTP